jgi:glycosyltransferase involved in cell wall biosynthesis
MRLLHLANGNLFGGIETFLVTLARLEKERGLARSSFVLSHEGHLADELRAAESSVQVLPGARLRKPWAIKRVRARVREEALKQGPDMVIAHGPWAYFVFGHALCHEKVPLVFWQHGLASTDLLHLLAARCPPTAVIANSQVTAQSTPRVFPGTPTYVVRYPVREMFPNRSRQQVRKEIGAGDDVVIIQTSRFEPWKGHALLLKALLHIPQLPWQLWLAGAQSRPVERKVRAELESLACKGSAEARVKFLGERRDIADLLGAADVFCQPNIGREPYGLGPVEALGAGLPIVVTEPGATALQVSTDWGRLVPVSTTALAKALEELLQSPDLRARMGESARSYHRDSFSPTQLLSEMGATLQRIVNSRVQ